MQPRNRAPMTLALAPMVAGSARIQINIVSDFRYHVEQQYSSEIHRLDALGARAAGTDEEMAVSDERWILDEIRDLADEMNTQIILRWLYNPLPKKLHKSDCMAKRLKCDFGLDVQTLPNFKSVDELRLLNNDIKHSKRASSQVAKYPGWVEGERLSNLGAAFQRLARRNEIPKYLHALAAAIICGATSPSAKL